MSRTITRLSAALITAGLVAVAAPASAHVGVSSTDAAPGGFGKAVFRVPNESDTAATTKIVVTLPTATPFAFVTAGAKPGWTAQIATEKLPAPTKVGDYELTEAVSTITWTADGDGIPVDQFDEFAISGGPFPEADSMSFAVVQTYSDGEVSTWDEEQTGDTEPERPAPVLALAASTGSDHHGAAAADEATDGATGASADSDDTSVAVIAGTALGAAALVVAAAALVVALRQNRRRA